MAMNLRIGILSGMLLAGCGSSDDSRYVEVRFPTGKVSAVPAPLDRLSPDKMLPRVVHRSYFATAGLADIDDEPDRYGVVRPLGNELYAFVVQVDGSLVRNVHLEHLKAANLTADGAWEKALGNLRQVLMDGKTIKQMVTKANDGRDWAVWLGNEFTSSTVLLPELYSWSREHMKGESFLVRIASTQMILILQQSHESDLPHFDAYIEKVLEGQENLVSDRWFTLTASGIRPFASQ